MLRFARLLCKLITGTLLALMSLIGLVAASLFLLVYYCCYRFIWLFSSTAAIERSKSKFEYRQQKLIFRAKKQRSNYSRTADLHNIEELVEQIEQQLQNHQQHLDAHLVEELRYLLGRYQQDIKFDKTLHIHAIVTNTDASSLNTALAKLLNDTTVLD